MWKSFFWAVGIFLLILGGETLIVDKFVMADSRRIPRLMNGTTSPMMPASYGGQYGAQPNYLPGVNRTIETKDWMPWSLLAAGAVTVMYTSSLQRRSNP